MFIRTYMYIHLSKQPWVMDRKVERWSKICCFFAGGVRNCPRGIKDIGSRLQVHSIFYKSLVQKEIQ